MSTQDNDKDRTEGFDLDNDIPRANFDDDEPIRPASRARAARTDDYYEDEEALADEIPSANRQTGKNKVVTVLGFVFMGFLTLLLLWWVNTRPAPEPTTRARDTTSRLPSISVPPIQAPPPPIIEERIEVVEETPYDAILRRRMSGNVVAGGGSGGAGRGQSGSGAGGARGVSASGSPAEQSDLERMLYLQQLGNAAEGNGNPPADVTAIASRGRLAGQLDPTVTEAVKAGVLPNRNFVLAKGTTLDCVLETAIDSTVPGMTTCQLTRDIYSDNGKVLLLDRGTQLVGEYSGGLRQGQARMFMLWTRAKTPNGVVVNLDSPATDELGRSGVDGHIENFFWKRFGAAILMSIISDGIAATRDGNEYFNNSSKAGEKVVDQMLQQHANIPPRLVRNQGTRISVMVARDLDFSEVYALKTN